MFAHLLVPVDGSASTRQAVEHGLALAAATGATVHALYVRDVSSLPGGGAALAADEELAATFDGAARRALDSVETAAEVDGVSVPVVRAVRTGKPAEEVLSYAAANDVDFVLLGSHRRGPRTRFLRTGVADRIRSAATVPVLTVYDGGSHTDIPYRRILLATDGQPGSRRAENCALALAAAYGATLHALYVVDRRFGRSGPLHGTLEQEAMAVGRAVAVRAVREGVEVVTAVEMGRPAKAILGYADANDVDLIVVGSRERTGLDRLVMGSVAERLLDTASVPVVTARA
jgi:nucleotide-binding universal stress UspA family protein